MTARERAKLITPEFSQKAFYADAIESLIEQAIIAAVEEESAKRDLIVNDAVKEEREWCALILDTHLPVKVFAIVGYNQLEDAEGMPYTEAVTVDASSLIRAHSNLDPA